MKAQQISPGFEGGGMIDWSSMLNMVYPMVQQQIAQFPPEKRVALSKIEARVVKRFPEIKVELMGDGTDPEVKSMMETMFNSLGETLPKVTSLLGLKVKLYE